MPYIVKKTLDAILESGNDYLVQVKQNCPTLYKNLIISTQTYEKIDSYETFDRQKGRDEYRYYEVHGVCEQTQKWLDKNGWNGIQRIIKIHRYGTRDSKPFDEKALFILSRPLQDAQKIAQGIRGHWKIENDLHYSKDIFFKEDHISIKKPKQATVIAFFIAIAYNLLKINNVKPSLDAFAFFSNKVNELFNILNLNFVSYRT
jgi:predicted transposase YbfD/YdcC